MHKLFYFFVFICSYGFAQKPTFKLDFNSFADNREYFNAVQNPQTIFGYNVSPTLRFSNDDVHSLHIGANMLYEFGSQLKDAGFSPIAYYGYTKENVSLKFGAFPRKGLTSNYPAFQLYDTLNYYRPVVQGFMINVGKEKKHIKAWVDWTSRQTETQREQFFVGIDAKYTLANFFVQNHFVMFHDAGTAIKRPTDVLTDNLSNQIGVGYFVENAGLDSLSFSVNLASGFERKRSLNEVRKPKGLVSYIYAQKNWAAIRNTYYTGDSFEQINGDHFYRSKNYNRTDLILLPIRNKNINMSFIWSLHLIGNDLNHQQALQIRYEL